ncbi:MAG: ABC transporter permease [Candidatus Rokuibacteriota bacterium]
MATSVALAAVVFLLLLTFVLWPVVTVLVVGVPGAMGPPPSFAPMLGNSLAVSAVSTAVTVLLALVVACAATRTTVPGRRILGLVRFLPVVSPPFLVSLALILLAGPTGVVTRSLGLHWDIDGFHGIVVAQVLTFLPHAYSRLAGALGSVDPALEAAAESLGAGPLMTLRRVTLVLVRPGLASASLTVFVLCMTDFANPILVGGRVRMLTTEIYAHMARLNDVTAASALSVILMAPCLAAYLINTCWVGARANPTVSADARTALRPTPAVVRWPLFAVSGGIVGVIAVLYAVVPLVFLARLWGGDGVLSDAWPVWDSVKLALLCGVAGTSLALVAASVIARRRPWGARALESLALLPAALPGIVIGVGYVLAFGGPPLRMAGTIWGLVAAVVFWKLPVALPTAVSALRRIDPALEEAATNLGAGTVRTFTRVVLPLLTGAALSIFVSFFVDGMVAVSAVVFLTHPGLRLGSVAILEQVVGGSLDAACTLATGILAIALGSVLLLRAVGGGGAAALLETGWRRSAT